MYRFILALVLLVCEGTSRKIPKDFKFGTSTAAFQVEGAWNVSGKGESIWDRFTHSHPELVRDHSNGDVACDTYHEWREDIEILKDLGVDFHRFSLSWPRILPDGFARRINPDGVRFYNDFINKLLKNNIEPLFGWWANPIFSNTGDYPEVMKQRVDERSRLENFTISRLPALTTDEIKMIKGTADFLGLNHYHTWLVGDHDFPIDGEPSHEKDMGIKSRQDPNWKPSPQIVPWGFRKLMNWIKEKYNNPLVYITENGYGDISEALEDHDRVTQIKLFIQAVMDAVEKDGCNVKRYTYWSTLDNMEWSLGYTVKFGLYHVDFTSPNRTRTPKLSAKTFKDIIRKRQL
ncbi:unnamed protein product [Acanthoscelides obtectus]|uniref:Myrosinase 1-like n=1 Tax=Acanthoscelides obtectus TaxID=200917 RepID=A0A9P0LDT7_ACAOB|nr:unnamed protein product [Acanthoscelides obtectus]CAK1663886.1 Lactase-phlorizin hydrolase [Acanthoscelides obtectus]